MTIGKHIVPNDLNESEVDIIVSAVYQLENRTKELNLCGRMLCYQMDYLEEIKALTKRMYVQVPQEQKGRVE